MNWGHKITLTIVVFIIAMLSMVFIAFQQNNEMMDDNYYDKELKYQSLIDASQNLNEESSDTLIEKTEKGFLITIPAKLRTNFKNGKIEFIGNEDRKKDFTLKIEPDSMGLFLIEPAKLSRGSYKVRILWENEGKSYYREQNLTVSQ